MLIMCQGQCEALDVYLLFATHQLTGCLEQPCEVDTIIILTTDEGTGRLAIWSTGHLAAPGNRGSEIEGGVVTPRSPGPHLVLLLQ